MFFLLWIPSIHIIHNAYDGLFPLFSSMKIHIQHYFHSQMLSLFYISFVFHDKILYINCNGYFYICIHSVIREKNVQASVYTWNHMKRPIEVVISFLYRTQHGLYSGSELSEQYIDTKKITFIVYVLCNQPFVCRIFFSSLQQYFICVVHVFESILYVVAFFFFQINSEGCVECFTEAHIKRKASTLLSLCSYFSS